MGAYLAISLIVSIAMSALSAGISINQLNIASKNQSLKAVISDFISQVNSEINKGRTSINKIVSLLANRNQSALMTYLYNNPVISKSLSALQDDTDLVALIQSKQSSLESELQSLYSELQTLGYSQTTKGTKQEDARRKEIESKIGEVEKKYSDLSDQAKNINLSTTTPVKPYTSDLDARSQNIIGGMK